MDPWITDHLGTSYPALLNYVRMVGWRIPSRGGEVKEIPDFALHLLNPRNCVVGRPAFSHRFMRLEIDMLLAGCYDPVLTEMLSPAAAGLITPMTAYGPRVRHQVPLVIDELRADPHSRRAVVYVGRDDDLRALREEPETRAGEMPCTCLWQFLVREDRLHMIVYMRSWDAVWGLSYDVPCFVSVQVAMARALRLPLGEYHHHAGSFHVYERHYAMDATPKDEPLNVEVGDDWHETRELAGARLQGLREELSVAS